MAVQKTSEYNYYCDPEASRIVLNSALPITILPWEARTDDKFEITVVNSKNTYVNLLCL